MSDWRDRWKDVKARQRIKVTERGSYKDESAFRCSCGHDIFFVHIDWKKAKEFFSRNALIVSCMRCHMRIRISLDMTGPVLIPFAASQQIIKERVIGD